MKSSRSGSAGSKIRASRRAQQRNTALRKEESQRARAQKAAGEAERELRKQDAALNLQIRQLQAEARGEGRGAAHR